MDASEEYLGLGEDIMPGKDVLGTSGFLSTVIKVCIVILGFRSQTEYESSQCAMLAEVFEGRDEDETGGDTSEKTDLNTLCLLPLHLDGAALTIIAMTASEGFKACLIAEKSQLCRSTLSIVKDCLGGCRCLLCLALMGITWAYGRRSSFNCETGAHGANAEAKNTHCLMSTPLCTNIHFYNHTSSLCSTLPYHKVHRTIRRSLSLSLQPLNSTIIADDSRYSKPPEESITSHFSIRPQPLFPWCFPHDNCVKLRKTGDMTGYHRWARAREIQQESNEIPISGTNLFSHPSKLQPYRKEPVTHSSHKSLATNRVSYQDQSPNRPRIRACSSITTGAVTVQGRGDLQSTSGSCRVIRVFRYAGISISLAVGSSLRTGRSVREYANRIEANTTWPKSGSNTERFMRRQASSFEAGKCDPHEFHGVIEGEEAFGPETNRRLLSSGSVNFHPYHGVTWSFDIRLSIRRGSCQLYLHKKVETYHASVQACRICRQRFNVTYRLPRGSEDDTLHGFPLTSACKSKQPGRRDKLPSGPCFSTIISLTVAPFSVLPRLAFDEMEGESIWMQTDWAPPTLSKFARPAHQSSAYPGYRRRLPVVQSDSSSGIVTTTSHDLGVLQSLQSAI
ncbi:hypothetical protein CCUS01_10133 [Colletotrichum cuscutae]|uniref:Uncharacterized protein n=1 Tax=Colletotrichum cuscutae TaxID=1209917 RepID=A0AAI9XND0_9PEZI|nr:hypothetical protein CCUS01_10133 [Colletotrichum cuscutae]